MQQIKFRFTVQSSHVAATPNYSGSDQTILVDEKILENVDFLGYAITSASIQRIEENYEVTVDFSVEVDLDIACSFVEDFASYVTYQLSYSINHFYGSPYIDIDYGSFYRDNGEGLRDYLQLNVKRTVHLSSIQRNESRLHELVHFYFLGMQSNNPKAKFFNLFLVLEAIEGSAFAETIFSDGTLFSQEEKTLISDTAGKMGDDRKKGVVRSILHRTQESRHVKLHAVLHALGITHVPALNDSPTPITLQNIKALIDTRNKLFHKGHHVDETQIWGLLIPLTRTFVALLARDPETLEREPVAAS